MRDSVRLVWLLAAALLSTGSYADDLRWTFDSLPADSLMGDASIGPVGPTDENFKGMPPENMALRLDGDGDYVRVPDEGEDSVLDFSVGDPITIEAWVRLDRIGDGQNVYVVGKGRTHLNGPSNNQNYALRLRSIRSQACVSFLFRSQATDEQASDWHRWTSDRGFAADGSWHHVAVTYRFGDSESIRGYVDGKPTKGLWDMGGATDREPVVDDDELWIGSSLGGNAGNSLCGAIDEVVIERDIATAKSFVNRRVVITRPPVVPKRGLVPGSVTVFLSENVTSLDTLNQKLSTPLMSYVLPAFAIPRIPVAYGRGGVRRAWDGPVVISAMADIRLPPGPIEWMVRAGGTSRLWIGDEIVARTGAHLGPTSGHGKVLPYTEPDPWLRPLHPGHHQEIVRHQSESDGPTRVVLQTTVGGKGLRYEAGEVLVAYRTDPEQPWQILTPHGGVPLTDEDWRPLESKIDRRMQLVDDRNRRMAASSEDEHWKARHQLARAYVKSLPPLETPDSAPVHDSHGTIDRLIHARIESEGKGGSLTAITSDDQFIRRLYLDTVGVIPSAAERHAFAVAAGDRQQKRSDLIDLVLEDPRWADHWTSYWMDVLAENPNVLKPSLNNSGPFRWYLYDVLRDNVAVDRWVTGLLRMGGDSSYGGPAGFGIAAQNDVPMAAKAHIVTSAFLGANLKCARCHDAPYHDWTQRDLFSIAAMLARKPIKVPKSSSVPDEFFGEGDREDALITLSVSPGESVEADWPLGDYTSPLPLDQSLVADGSDSRERLAAFLTRPQNQQFARTIVNRIWQRLMGEAIVQPVDDWEGARPSHPMLLDHLARELTASGYDLKHVARLILNSQTYQRVATDRPPTNDASARLFASPRLRRMTAEQIVDSIHVAVGRPMDCDELTFDPEARMKPAAQSNLGRPRRAWQLTSLSNERDRPALSLPKAAAVTECLEAFGWSGARQDPINHRQTAANVIQPGILSGGMLSIQMTRVMDGDGVTADCLAAKTPDELVTKLFVRFLTREPTEAERKRFVALLREGFDKRVLTTPMPAETPIREPDVSWANHLSPEATEVRLRQSERLRLGPSPSRWLRDEWRQRAEDATWALMNTPEFLFIR